MAEGDNYLGKRYFRDLSDEELTSWRPRVGEYVLAQSSNISAANREMRKRAAKAGLSSVYEWLDSLKD